MSNRGSAGGKARAIIEKIKAKERIDEYNKNPNYCMCCGSPILAPNDKSLYQTRIKKFCSQSCAARFNNIGKSRNNSESNNNIYQESLINKFTDEEIIQIFNDSSSIKEFSEKLGYKSKIGKRNKYLNKKLIDLGLNMDDLKSRNITRFINLTKGELFDKRNNWQCARSQIQKHARKVYADSNKPKQCIVCGYDKHYEVAHIKAVSEFDDEVLVSEINDIDNLIALCPNHHWEYDNTDFDIHNYLYKITA